MIMQVIGATIGTMAFSLLYGVPKQYYPCCGLVGGAGWLIYLLTKPIIGTALGAFCSTVFLVLLSRIFAVKKQCPVTIFLIAGIFPLVPGAGICMTSYYVVVNDIRQAFTTGFMAMKIAVSIVLGIVIVFGMPQKWFQRLGNISLRRKEKEFS